VNIADNAIIDASAHLAEGVTVGPFSVIGANAVIGEGTEIGPQAVIEAGSVIGKNCRIFQGAAIGGEPQILGFDRDIPSSVRIGDHTTIREFVTVHRSGKENESTVIGDHCMLMAYSHVAHDCHLGNHVIIVNYTGLSGHIVVEDYAFVSGLVGMHQFIRIGTNSMVGGVSRVIQDILPFSLVVGVPAELRGVNSVGLRRRNFKPEVRRAIKDAFKILMNSELNTTQAVERIENEIEMLDEISHLIKFIKSSERGYTGK
jgi:UDP-N-acetylglucosamine acyltransferase